MPSTIKEKIKEEAKLRMQWEHIRLEGNKRKLHRRRGEKKNRFYFIYEQN